MEQLSTCTWCCVTFPLFSLAAPLMLVFRMRTLLTQSHHNLFACRGPCLAATDNFKNTQLWVVPAKGTDGLIRLAGTNQCLDAGSPPLVNGRILKTWTWYVPLSLSIFFYRNQTRSSNSPPHLDVRRCMLIPAIYLLCFSLLATPA